MYSNLYHIHRPTQVKEIGKRYSVAPDISDANNIKSLLLHGFKVPPTEDFLESRKIILTNSDCHIALAAPKKSMTEYFYKRSEEHTSELQSRGHLVCRLLLEKK